MATKRKAGGRPQKRRWAPLWWTGGLLAVLGIVVYSLFAGGLLGGSTASGEPAPDVTLATADGPFRLSEQRGDVVVLYFSFPG